MEETADPASSEASGPAGGAQDRHEVPEGARESNNRQEGERGVEEDVGEVGRDGDVNSTLPSPFSSRF